jgi:protein-S-isoprenylcysteine O-methyltransferase Ste14
MWIYLILLGVIWIGLLIPVVQERRAWIICAHGGTGLFFTSLFLSLGLNQTGNLADILWLRIFGYLLLVPAVFLFIGAMVAISKGKLVTTGVMKIVRHPMYLGTAIAAFAVILIFQSILSFVLSVIAIVLLWLASKLEEDMNIEQFGDPYREQMTRVPRWNLFKGLLKG